MKKRVRYLAAAAAGLAPAVGAVAVPTAAHASDGCVGHTEFWLPEVFAYVSAASVGVKGHGWYTNESANKVCIGTVVVSNYTQSTGYDWPGVSVVSGNGRQVYKNTHKVYGTAGNWAHASFGVHSEGKYSMSVTAWSNYFYWIKTHKNVT